MPVETPKPSATIEVVETGADASLTTPPPVTGSPKGGHGGVRAAPRAPTGGTGGDGGTVSGGVTNNPGTDGADG